MQESIESTLLEGDLKVLMDSELASLSGEDESSYYDNIVEFHLDDYLSLVPFIKKKVKSLKNLKSRNISEEQTRFELIHKILRSIIADGHRLYSEKTLPNSRKRADMVIETTDGVISCVIECKRLNNELGPDAVLQLQEYMRIAKCSSGILTNGEEYQVYYYGDCWVYNVKNFVYAKEFEKFLNTIANGVVSNLRKI